MATQRQPRQGMKSRAGIPSVAGVVVAERERERSDPLEIRLDRRAPCARRPDRPGRRRPQWPGRGPLLGARPAVGGEIPGQQRAGADQIVRASQGDERVEGLAAFPRDRRHGGAGNSSLPCTPRACVGFVACAGNVLDGGCGAGDEAAARGAAGGSGGGASGRGLLPAPVAITAPAVPTAARRSRSRPATGSASAPGPGGPRPSPTRPDA